MQLNASHEFWTIIEELASGSGRIQERAAYTNKRFVHLESSHVPEALRGDFKTLKSLSEGAQNMSEEDAFNFIMKILSFYGRLTATGS